MNEKHAKTQGASPQQERPATKPSKYLLGKPQYTRALACGCWATGAFDCMAVKRKVSRMNRIEPCKCACHK